MVDFCSNIRPNTVGDRPQIHPSAYIDPAAVIVGNVHIAQNVFVGPTAVIRADEPGPDGKVWPVTINAETNIHDGVNIHASGGSSVEIGSRVTLAHGVIIHGPCTIEDECFLALRVTVYNAVLKKETWVGLGTMIMHVTIPSYTMIPAGTIIRSKSDAIYFRTVNKKESRYHQASLNATNNLREGYLALARGENLKDLKE
ncbi:MULTISPECIES: LbetaH domain-containing protein [Desulfobacula]|uniref:Transferase hexapeptide repeat containing protein n=2 Tax=Desulfobacula TaxID=28222 RepID=K0NI33_DESTT|nr:MULTISPECIES: transferase hexapeptide repeat containing protein [Desulfobacula]CCK81026.1 transferase hexapeptide repeat containing protein [Desulfobacula toluolica Tol2]SDT84899.1 Carbonic anhydrase or acetyltransferase, isoleucine patch superfamily [Desulfobacula phenolica]